MDQSLIFLPVCVLALWTLLVLSLIPLRRFRAAAKRQVTAEDFRFGESGRVPPDVSIPNRAWMNLLEAPLLFYVGVVVYFLLGEVDEAILALAWVYVALRIAHSLIHISYNNVIHRLTAFALSNVTLIVMWVMLLMRVWPGQPEG